MVIWKYQYPSKKNCWNKHLQEIKNLFNKKISAQYYTNFEASYSKMAKIPTLCIATIKPLRLIISKTHKPHHTSHLMINDQDSWSWPNYSPPKAFTVPDFLDFCTLTPRFVSSNQELFSLFLALLAIVVTLKFLNTFSTPVWEVFVLSYALKLKLS